MRYRLLGDLNVGDRFQFNGSQVLTGKVDFKQGDTVEVLIDAPSEGGRRVRPRREQWHRTMRVQKL